MSKASLRDTFLATWRLLARTAHEGHAYPEPEAEYGFHFARKWRFDFAWPNALVALEIEGGLFMEGGGAHSHPTNIMRDVQKYNVATFMGWAVIRMADREVRANPVDTCVEIARLIKHRRLDGVSPYAVDSYGLVPVSGGQRRRAAGDSPPRRRRKPDWSDVYPRKDDSRNGQGNFIDYGKDLPF